MKIGEESIVFLVAVSLWERTLEKNRKVEKKTFISDCFHVLEGGGEGEQEFGVSCVIKSQ